VCGILAYMDTATWYASLIKPAWAPPTWVFGPVWTFLYAVIAVSFGAVFLRALAGTLPWIVALPFGLNLFFNLIFTPIQFGLKSNALASLDILLVLASLVWAQYAIYPHMKWVAFVNIPYLVWVVIATTLQLTITYLNW
jgi:translocator protein